MTKGSKCSGQSASKAVATTGSVPVKTTVSFKGGERSYETKSRFSYGDKQSGSYGRATTTEKTSAGAFQWKNGTTGTRNEYKQSSTVRVGDKKGYTEVYNEQRVRNVTYDKSKNYITYNNHDGGRYGGCDDDSDDSGSYNNESDEGGSYDNESDDGGSYDNESDGGGSYVEESDGGGSYVEESDGGGSYGGSGSDNDEDEDEDDGYGYDSD